MRQKDPDTRAKRARRAADSTSGSEQPTRHPDETRLQVRWSPIHGRGVFAAAAIRKGERIIEYKGRRVKWSTASRAHRDVEGRPTHTFLFELDEEWVIDATSGGNKARWINHSCSPNCRAVQEDDRIFIEAIRHIRTGEELGYDYNIRIGERLTPTEKKRWPCFCGARTCRGTLLVPKRKRPSAGATRPSRKRTGGSTPLTGDPENAKSARRGDCRNLDEVQPPAEPMKWDEAA
jgi:uncharacterized protein